MYRRGKISDAKVIAKIHFSEFDSDFLPSLGEKFLQLLHLNFIQNKNTYVWVAYSGNRIQGFIVGSKNFKVVFKKILINNFIKYTFLIVPQILKRPSIAKNVIETLLYTNKVGVNIPDAELIVISILKKYQRKGVGRNLVFALESSFLSDSLKTYKVSVNATNHVANSFYTALDFKKKHEFSLYGKKINLYIKQIK